MPFAQKVLSRLNYYTFTGYLHDYKTSSDQYQPGTTFEDILTIYQCDKRFKSILLYCIDEIEHNLKNKIAYIFAHTAGELAYTKHAYFKDVSKHQDFMVLFYNAVSRNKSLPFVKHHLNHYGGEFPIWVAIELFSFGMLKNFYQNLKTGLQKKIAKEFGLSVSLLEDWMGNIVYLRNMCAHYMRLYNLNLSRVPAKDKFDADRPPYSHKVYDIIYIMKTIILNTEDWNGYILPTMEHIFEQYDEYINIAAYGFPENWQTVLRI